MFSILNRSTAAAGYPIVNVNIKGELMVFDISDIKEYFTEKEPEAISEFQTDYNKDSDYGSEISRQDALDMLASESFTDDEIIARVAAYYYADFIFNHKND